MYHKQYNAGKIVLLYETQEDLSKLLPDFVKSDGVYKAENLLGMDLMAEKRGPYMLIHTPYDFAQSEDEGPMLIIGELDKLIRDKMNCKLLRYMPSNKAMGIGGNNG